MIGVVQGKMELGRMGFNGTEDMVFNGGDEGSFCRSGSRRWGRVGGDAKMLLAGSCRGSDFPCRHRELQGMGSRFVGRGERGLGFSGRGEEEGWVGDGSKEGRCSGTRFAVA